MNSLRIHVFYRVFKSLAIENLQFLSQAIRYLLKRRDLFFLLLLQFQDEDVASFLDRIRNLAGLHLPSIFIDYRVLACQ